MVDDIETSAVEDAAAGATAATERAVDAVVDAAEDVGAVVTESIPAAMVGAMDRILAGQSQINQRLDAIENNFTETMNALSRAQANTDVSAQRAAESAGVIAEELQPPEEAEPANVQPERIKELPVQQQGNASRYRQLGFGKASQRHAGGSR